MSGGWEHVAAVGLGVLLMVVTAIREAQWLRAQRRKPAAERAEEADL